MFITNGHIANFSSNKMDPSRCQHRTIPDADRTGLLKFVNQKGVGKDVTIFGVTLLSEFFTQITIDSI